MCPAASISAPRKRVRVASAGFMVGIAQLVERRVVVANVAGSSPVTHPNAPFGALSRISGAIDPRVTVISSCSAEQFACQPSPL